MNAIYRELIPVTEKIPGKPLGRHIRRDTRDANFPAETATVFHSIRHRAGGDMPLNQQETESCTAHALTGSLNCVPHWAPGKPVLGEKDAYAVYSDEEEIIYGQPYPPEDGGGTGGDVCQAAKNRGWLALYQHATDIKSALLALVIRPVITGVNWYTSFDNPASDGKVSIAPGATVRGGHEICADELIVPSFVTAANILQNLDQIWVGLWNSWGLQYGDGGRFYWTGQTWAELLIQGGDVTIPRTAPGWTAKPL
jgi:hypothetical protein